MAKKIDKKLSEVLIGAYGCLILATVLVLIAFSTPYWLTSEERLYGAKFVRLGLWEQCFRSITIPEEPFDNVYFTGCRWIYTPWTYGYDKLREQLIMKPFFVAVQFFFTLCFVFCLIGCLVVILFTYCFGEERMLQMLYLAAADVISAAVCGFLAVLLFGIYGDGPDWIPEPTHNYLSWSFGLAFCGMFFLVVSSLLFIVQIVRLRRKGEDEKGFTLGGPKPA